MRFGITGHSGRIGKLLIAKGCVPLECDVTDPSQIERAIAQVKPDVVAHLASISNVNECEEPSNKEKVIKVNLRGTSHVLEACITNQIPMVFLSTDHIFDGKRGPYSEKDKPMFPTNFYGMSKLAAEALVRVESNAKVIRTSFLFDGDRILSAWSSRFVGYPTFIKRSFLLTEHFVELMWKYLNILDAMPQILNLSGSKTVSWYEFMLDVASIFGASKSMVEPRHRDIPSVGLASRPRSAGLKIDLSRKLGFHQYSYVDGLRRLKEKQILKELGY